MSLPKIALIQQNFPNPKLGNIEKIVINELKKLRLAEKIPPQSTIGISVGSRGIQNIVLILKTTIKYLKSINLQPVLISAMGSHGNGSIEGQQKILESLGITERSMGVPIKISKNSLPIGKTPRGLTAYILDAVFEVDFLLIINRIKTHTSFKGKIESGLIKKIVVGLGGPKGAAQFHNYNGNFLSLMLEEIGKLLLTKLPIIGGLGIVENAFKETCLIKGIKPEKFITKEEKILKYSKKLMPSLPVKKLDLLIIKEIGKNFAGTGMDTNIVGRIKIEGEPEPPYPVIKRIAVLDLSEKSHGNATGIGLADFTTKKLVSKIDFNATYSNCLTSTFVLRSAIPMHFSTEKELLQKALFSLRYIPLDKLSLIIIPNTLDITKLYISESLIPQLKENKNIEILQKSLEILFDKKGNFLLPFK